MKQQRTILTAAFAVALLSGSACVKKGLYEESQTALSAANSSVSELAAENDALRERLLAGTTGDTDQTRRALESERALRNSLSESEQLRALLQDRRELHEQCIAQYQQAQRILSNESSERQELAARVSELSALQEAAQQREEMYQQILDRFQDMIDAGQLSVTNRRGRLVIDLPQDILFRSASATLGREGEETIAAVGEVLSSFSDREFQVEGHTDDVPISTARFPSNWELSTARALAVVKLLIEEGMPATNISAAGYGEFAPRVANDTAENRAENRRIEIVLVPDVDMFDTTVP